LPAGQLLTFITPYWHGPEMMRLHLASVRAFHPAAPILVSAKGGNHDEMEAHRAAFGIRYWMEDCGYVDALIRLLDRVETRYVCIMDHDTVLLSGLEDGLRMLDNGRWDLIGIEERIREPAGIGPFEDRFHGWWRFAPGYMDATFLLFDWQAFKERWGLRGIKGDRSGHVAHFEFHYGICEKLTQHKYLLPYHTRRYGLGNLVKLDDQPLLWHQWYGSYRKRISHDAREHRELLAVLANAERAFLDDYPDLDLAELSPAWGEGTDMGAALAMIQKTPRTVPNPFHTLGNWRRQGLRDLAKRARSKLSRWWRLH
jgi:hypothetical protein